MTLTYAGIGSRATPENVQMAMELEVSRLAGAGYTLRSGAADGADSAFERAAINGGRPYELYLPWKGFNGRSGAVLGDMAKAERLASSLHPAWNNLSQGAKKLHSRNCFQILGPNLDDPVKFVLCWTPDGAETEAQRSRVTGGTGTAIVLASRNNCPVINMKNEGWMSRVNSIVSGEGHKALPVTAPSAVNAVILKRQSDLLLAIQAIHTLTVDQKSFVSSYKHLVEGLGRTTPSPQSLAHLSEAQGNYLSFIASSVRRSRSDSHDVRTYQCHDSAGSVGVSRSMRYGT